MFCHCSGILSETNNRDSTNLSLMSGSVKKCGSASRTLAGAVSCKCSCFWRCYRAVRCSESKICICLLSVCLSNLICWKVKITCRSDDSGRNVRINIYMAPFLWVWHFFTLRKEHRWNVLWLGRQCGEGAFLASREEIKAEKLSEYWDLAGKSERQIPLRRSRHTWRMVLNVY
jgi:hypothetical protein